MILNNNLNVLIWDIEISPRQAVVWGTGKQYVTRDQIIEDNFIICIAWKWRGEKKVHSLDINECGSEKKLLRKFRKVLDKADISIYHNGDSFDRKEINTRLVMHGLPPVSLSKSYDTYKLAKKHFRFDSNSLDNICDDLNLDRKLKTGLDLWIKCLNLNKKAIHQMVRYNKRDVKINEDLFNRLLPYIELPVSLHSTETMKSEVSDAIRQHRCTHCGNEGLHTISGKYVTKTGKTRYYLKCGSCGAHNTLGKLFKDVIDY